MALVQTYGKCNLGKYTMIDLQIVRRITWMLLKNKLMALDLYILSWKTLFRVGKGNNVDDFLSCLSF